MRKKDKDNSDKNTSNENNLFANTSYESTSGENTSNESTSGESTSDENTSSESTSGESTSSESTSSESISGENTSNENNFNRKHSNKKRRKSARKEEAQLIRIQRLEQIMAEEGVELDPETIVSMYMPGRKAKRLGASILRLDKMHIALVVLVFTIGILFIMAFMQEKMGNFTINLNRLELYRKGIAIAETGRFEEPTARLSVNTVQDATNISLADLPDNLDEIDGDHNGRNYMAYTYYVRNAGKEDVSYIANVRLDACSKGAEQAVRVAVWRNGERTVYAMPAQDGGPEEFCENFLSDKLVCSYAEENFLVGNVDKYTIVIWMEGDDPECVDSIVGGSVEFSMTIDAMDSDDTSLLVKFIKDIKDTLTGDKPISAAGNEAPSYYNEGEVTWENRRNQ